MTINIWVDEGEYEHMDGRVLTHGWMSRVRLYMPCLECTLFGAVCVLQHTATRCNALQRTATHCNTLQRTRHAGWGGTCAATHCNILLHIATHIAHCLERCCSTLQHTTPYCNTQCIHAGAPCLCVCLVFVYSMRVSASNVCVSNVSV